MTKYKVYQVPHHQFSNARIIL